MLDAPELLPALAVPADVIPALPFVVPSGDEVPQAASQNPDRAAPTPKAARKRVMRPV
jgi:hypothetical protein